VAINQSGAVVSPRVATSEPAEPTLVVVAPVHNERMDGDRRRAERDAELMDGLPQTLHSPLTPLGEIEQAGKIAAGLRHPREGWRRVVVPVGLVFLAIMLISAVLGWTFSRP
jgi:hypothetical protein